MDHAAPTESKQAARKRAQRLITATECQECGATGVRLDRHHPNILGEPLRVEILCQPCHVKADMRDGTRKTKELKVCTICGQDFLPPHTTSQTCSRECFSESARRNANARWANRLTTRACAWCGTEFTPDRPRKTMCSLSCANKEAWERRRANAHVSTDCVPLAMPSSCGRQPKPLPTYAVTLESDEECA